jgi:tRNA1Val (adenine37-N6)-methyltransferase
MSCFHFKKFSIEQNQCAMKISTDSTLLGAWADSKDAEFILDIGTGTGLLALMLAQKNDKARIIAVECDSEAYHQANENFKNSPWSDRIFAVFSKIQDYTPEFLSDLIICNPPYYSEKKFLKSNNIQKRIARSDSMLSFDDLAVFVSRFLNNEGLFYLVLPVEVEDDFIQIAASKGLFLNAKASVFTQMNKTCKRSLMRFSKKQTKTEFESIYIRDRKAEETVYSEKYQQLLKDFLSIF